MASGPHTGWTLLKKCLLDSVKYYNDYKFTSLWLMGNISLTGSRHSQTSLFDRGRKEICHGCQKLKKRDKQTTLLGFDYLMCVAGKFIKNYFKYHPDYL